MTSVLLDDIIFALQPFGGASDFWRQLSTALAERSDADVAHTRPRAWRRLLPVRTSRDVLHSSHFRVPLSRSTACVTTVHDLSYELGIVTGRSAPVNLWQRRQAVRRADQIICISENTKRDLLEFYRDDIGSDVPVRTIRHGRTYSGPSGASLPERWPRRPFVLFVGNRRGYKNFDNGLRGVAGAGAALDGVELWCTGSPFDEVEVALIRELGLESRVRSVGVVSTDELGALYEHATALLYPSSYEGFGLPPLDAMSLGCPVVAANRSSVPEVVGEAGLLVDPTSAEEIAAGLTVVMEPDRRSELVARGFERAREFSWSLAAAEHVEVYEDAARRR
jgi:glycosyltransferase involved in cell wall biosynthesis